MHTHSKFSCSFIQSNEVRNPNTDLIGKGLDLDFLGRPFGSVLELTEDPSILISLTTTLTPNPTTEILQPYN